MTVWFQFHSDVSVSSTSSPRERCLLFAEEGNVSLHVRRVLAIAAFIGRVSSPGSSMKVVATTAEEFLRGSSARGTTWNIVVMWWVTWTKMRDRKIKRSRKCERWRGVLSERKGNQKKINEATWDWQKQIRWHLINFKIFRFKVEGYCF